MDEAEVEVGRSRCQTTGFEWLGQAECLTSIDPRHSVLNANNRLTVQVPSISSRFRILTAEAHCVRYHADEQWFGLTVVG